MDMSQEDLARALGYKSKASIFKIENGTGDIPRSKLPRFASVLNCSISYLTGWDELKTFDDEHREKHLTTFYVTKSVVYLRPIWKTYLIILIL